MKKGRIVAWGGVSALVLAVGYLAAAHLSGGAWFTFGLPLGGDRGEVRRLGLAFWEDIQFKDFGGAAAFHEPDRQADVDIPFLIERIFLRKPEQLDISDLEVMLADIDSSGNRGRVLTRMRVRDLFEERVYDKEVMLYFYREGEGSPWYLDLESSLRELKPEEGKLH
jgi:hypothetical protein